MIACNLKQRVIVIAHILVETSTENTWAEDDCLATRCDTRHLVNQIDVVMAWHVSDIDWPAADATSSCVETGVVVHGLEHVPVGQDVEMLREQGVVGIRPNMPGV